MTTQEAKRALSLYRPNSADAEDPEVAAALAQVERDPELRRWFEQHCALQNALRAKFREIPVPDHLQQRILADRKIVRPAVWWRQPAWIAAAAVFIVLLGLSTLLPRPRIPDRFADYRERMVQTVLREYHMDVVTNDHRPVRQYMAAKGAPADYTLTKGLERLTLTGGGFLRWRGNPVSMVCFDRGDTQMLYLFVLQRSAVKDAPPRTPQVSRVNKLITASWTEGDETYVLAGPEDPDFPTKYL